MAKASPLRWLHPALFIAASIVVATAVRGAPASSSLAQLTVANSVAAVAWPPSDGLLVSEVVTGAGTASDEFVEIYNASATDRDLGGLELVYATASGSTVTRKQTWTQLTLGPHRHLLLANSAGKWATGADGLYSSGFAATGGSLVLRNARWNSFRLAELGRCRQRIRGGRRRPCAGRRIQPRAEARRSSGKRDRHERQSCRYPGRGKSAASVPGIRPCSRDCRLTGADRPADCRALGVPAPNTDAYRRANPVLHARAHASTNSAVQCGAQRRTNTDT